MYYEIYNALKGKLTSVEGVEGVEWFRNQYEAGAAQDGYVYIEGVSFTPQVESKAGGRATLVLRLHVATAAGSTSDALLETNDRLAARVLEAVEGGSLPFGEGATRPLELVSWTCLPKVADWMVALLELRAKA